MPFPWHNIPPPLWENIIMIMMIKTPSGSSSNTGKLFSGLKMKPVNYCHGVADMLEKQLKFYWFWWKLRHAISSNQVSDLGLPAWTESETSPPLFTCCQWWAPEFQFNEYVFLFARRIFLCYYYYHSGFYHHNHDYVFPERRGNIVSRKLHAEVTRDPM